MFLGSIDFHTMSYKGTEMVCIPAFFKISSFVFRRRKKLKQIWNYMRVRKLSFFGVYCPFKATFISGLSMSHFYILVAFLYWFLILTRQFQ